MRDFRDAKAMARTLREALKAKAVETSHSESLELIAKTFGVDSWNILAAKIDAAQADLSAAQVGKAQTLHCSFCHKSQHEVRKLIAGPNVFICDACVGLSDVILDGEELLDLFAGDASLDILIGEHQSRVARAEKLATHWRLTLDEIEHILSKKTRPGSPGFAYLANKEIAHLIALKDRHERALRRYEEAHRLVGERDP